MQIARVQTSPAQHAFSLVELSIVLVILGLLTGGILAGQSLIRASELRSIPVDLQRYTTAIHTFRDKYRALPGDMPNAVRFWGAQAGATTDGTDSTCAALTAAATSAATCNGNGDGRVPLGYEMFRAWQHMANAGLVEGSYTGVANAGGANLAIPGENVPRARISSVGVNYLNATTTTDSGSWFANSGATLLVVAKPYTDSELRVGFMKAEESWGIDTKIDDGKPGQGYVHSGRDTTDCTTTGVATTAEYLLTATTNGCFIRTYLR